MCISQRRRNTIIQSMMAPARIRITKMFDELAPMFQHAALITLAKQMKNYTAHTALQVFVPLTPWLTCGDVQPSHSLAYA